MQTQYSMYPRVYVYVYVHVCFYGFIYTCRCQSCFGIQPSKISAGGMQPPRRGAKPSAAGASTLDPGSFQACIFMWADCRKKYSQKAKSTYA